VSFTFSYNETFTYGLWPSVKLDLWPLPLLQKILGNSDLD